MGDRRTYEDGRTYEYVVGLRTVNDVEPLATSGYGRTLAMLQS
jgi:hypothetical protein